LLNLTTDVKKWKIWRND